MTPRIALRVLVLAASLAGAALPARAEESLDDIKARLAKSWEPWKGCEPGSWIQTRSRMKYGTTDTDTESRQTLVGRSDNSVTMETRIVKRTKDAEGKEVVELGDPQKSELPIAQAAAYADLKELRKEDVEVGDRKISCRVIEMSYVFKYAAPVNGQKEFRTKITMWISSEVQEMGGLVKTESDSDKQPFMGSWSSDMKLVEIGKEVKVGDTTVKCCVYRYGTTAGKEEMTGAGEVWMSADAPFGYVKVKMESNFASGASRTHMTMETEVTGMEIVKLKKD